MKTYTPQTDGATTEDWIKATEGMTITAYDPVSLTFNQAREKGLSVLKRVDFENSFSGVSQTTQPS
jgi:hypothetical protein